MKTILFLCLLLAGCASPKFLDNRQFCSVAGDMSTVVIYGISFEVSAKDVKAICKG